MLLIILKKKSVLGFIGVLWYSYFSFFKIKHPHSFRAFFIWMVFIWTEVNGRERRCKKERWIAEACVGDIASAIKGFEKRKGVQCAISFAIWRSSPLEAKGSKRFLRFLLNLMLSTLRYRFTFGFSGQGKKARDPEASRRSQRRSRFRPHSSLLLTRVHVQWRIDSYFLDVDASHCDLFPESAACKCYFFDNFGELSPMHHGTGFDSRFSDVLRRRFLRQGFNHRRRHHHHHHYLLLCYDTMLLNWRWKFAFCSAI